MQIYLVGGAVRDELLNWPIKERDWVVVGATPEQMLNLGYRPVGKDFPVFLHPITHEEYALARTERKIAPGYTGFMFHASPEVTLEQDLQRRDLTINAMAKSITGDLIDPYGGRLDLQNKLFRHVSTAFTEDPVRILRVARFAARLKEFTIHESTLLLMRQMVSEGEVNALVPERVWQEWQRALTEPLPRRFFEVLAQCDALPVLFSELVNNPYAFKALEAISSISDSALLRFSGLVSPLLRPHIERLFQRYPIPREYQQLGLLVHTYHSDLAQARQLTAEQLLTFLQALDAFRRPERFEQFLTVADAVNTQLEPTSENSEYLRHSYQIAQTVTAKDLINQGFSGAQIGQAIQRQRIDLLKRAIASF